MRSPERGLEARPEAKIRGQKKRPEAEAGAGARKTNRCHKQSLAEAKHRQK